MKKLILIILVLSLLIPTSVFANEHNDEEQENKEIPDVAQQIILEKVPSHVKSTLSDFELLSLEQASASAVVEAVFISQGFEVENAWNNLISEGNFNITSIIPVYDLEENLAEAMIVFPEGYILVDLHGNLLQFGFDEVNEEELNSLERAYIYEGIHYSTDSDGLVKEVEDKHISEIKKENKGQEIKSERANNKWGQLKKEERNGILSYFAGANEGTSVGNQITDPVLWLHRYYPNKHSGLRSMKVSQVENYRYSVPQYLQRDWKYKNDCALVSTLELMRWYWGVSDSTSLNKAYNAMANSSYFSESNGVSPFRNNDLFKIASEAIGKPRQSTGDDVGATGSSYSTVKSRLRTYGPGYLSMNHDPYGAHTVTLKGYAQYKVEYVDRFYHQKTDYARFYIINDHWAVTGTGSEFLYQNRSASSLWYYQFITKN